MKRTYLSPRVGLVLPLFLGTILLSMQARGQEGFRRGDSNGDGSVDISDGIATLSSLFVDGFPLRCADGADADDSGIVDVSDAIFTFSFLFLSGPQPPEPGPFECGCDFTDDGLTCDANSCIPETEVRSYVIFDRFTYRYEPLCGLSLEQVGQVVDAEILRQDDGTLTLRSISLEAADADCLPEYCDGCFVLGDEQARTLTTQEMTRLEEAFSALEVSLSEDSICSCYPIDPNGFRYFSWDAEAVSDDICAPDHLDWSAGEQLQSVIQELSAP